MHAHPAPTGRGPVLLVVALSYAAVGLSSGAIPVAVLGRGGDAAAVGLAMGVSAFTVVVARLACGRLMGRYGYRACLLVAALLLAAGCAAGAAPPAPVLIASRLVVGLGTGVMLAAATAWVVDLPGAHGRMANSLASIGTVNYLVLAAGAPLGTWLARALDPSLALALAALPPLAATGLLAGMTAPAAPSPAEAAPRRDPRARVHVLGVALALAAAGNPAVVAFGVVIGQAHRVATAPAVVAVYGLSLVAARIVLAPVTGRLTRPAPTVAMFAVEAAGIATLATAADPILFAAGAVLVGIGMAFTYPLVGAQFATGAGADKGAALAVLGAYVNVGIGLGAVVIGQIAARTTLQTGLLAAAAGTALAGLVTAWALTRRVGG